MGPLTHLCVKCVSPCPVECFIQVKVLLYVSKILRVAIRPETLSMVPKNHTKGVAEEVSVMTKNQTRPRLNERSHHL